MTATITPNIKNQLQKAKSWFPFESKPEFKNLVHWKGEINYPIHRWFRYREGYSPDLVNALNLGKRILDPFSGSGSILIGNAKSLREGVGIDLNPLACFVARTKISPLDKKTLRLITNFLITLPSEIITCESWPLPALDIANKIFEPMILETLQRIRYKIEELASVNANARNFLFLGWLSILEGVGSFFKEGNGIKYRNKKRTPNGYIHRIEGEWQLDRFGKHENYYVLERFIEQVKMMLEDVWYWKEGTWSNQTVINGNATEIDSEVFEKPFDSIVFSPPYANRFDYFESQKVELWFGNFVNSYSEMSQLRNKSLRSHLGADRNKETIELDTLENLINSMNQETSSWKMGVPKMLRGYFHDMYQTLKQCRQLAPKGECHVIVGNSAFAGVIIPTDSLVARLGIEAGFSSVKIAEVRHLTVSPQQRNLLYGLESHMRESIVSFK